MGRFASQSKNLTQVKSAVEKTKKVVKITKKTRRPTKKQASKLKISPNIGKVFSTNDSTSKKTVTSKKVKNASSVIKKVKK